MDSCKSSFGLGKTYNSILLGLQKRRSFAWPGRGKRHPPGAPLSASFWGPFCKAAKRERPNTSKKSTLFQSPAEPSSQKKHGFYLVKPSFFSAEGVFRGGHFRPHFWDAFGAPSESSFRTLTSRGLAFWSNLKEQKTSRVRRHEA